MQPIPELHFTNWIVSLTTFFSHFIVRLWIVFDSARFPFDWPPFHLAFCVIIDAARAGDKYETNLLNNGYSKYMKLKIRNVTKEDFGSYRCVAKNSLGETDGVIKLDGKLCWNQSLWGQKLRLMTNFNEHQRTWKSHKKFLFLSYRNSSANYHHNNRVEHLQENSK